MRASLLGFALLGAGCASVRPVSDPGAFISQANPRVVYVTHQSGALLTLSDPRVHGDSLLGRWEGAAQTLSLPLREVARIEAMQRDKTRTVLAIAGITVVTGALAYLITREAGPSRPCNFDGATQFQGCDNPR